MEYGDGAVFKFVIWLFVIYGINQIITEASIFSYFRKHVRNKFIKEIVNCILCNSVWVSFFVSYCLWSPIGSIFKTELFYSDISGVAICFAKAFPEIQNFIISSLNFILKIISMFFDGMMGSACVWFLHIIERKLSKG